MNAELQKYDPESFTSNYQMYCHHCTDTSAIDLFQPFWICVSLQNFKDADVLIYEKRS